MKESMRLEDIHTMRLEDCCISLMSKYKAIILLLASTGMRRDELVKIELKDTEYLKDHNLYKIKIYKKSKYEKICFTTPEAADAFKLYSKASMRNSAKYFHNVNSRSISMTLGNLVLALVQNTVIKFLRYMD